MLLIQVQHFEWCNKYWSSMSTMLLVNRKHANDCIVKGEGTVYSTLLTHCLSIKMYLRRTHQVFNTYQKRICSS